MGNMTQLWDGICILSIMYITESHENRTSRICSVFVDFRCAGGEKNRWIVKHIGCQLFYQLPVPWFQQTVPCQDRCQEMTAQAFLKVDNESQKQFENRCNFCCFQGQWGWVEWFGRWIARGCFVALFFFQKKSPRCKLWWFWRFSLDLSYWEV